MSQKPQIPVQKVHNNSLHLLGVVVVEVWGWGVGYDEVNLKLKSLKSSGTFDYVDAPETSDSSPEGTQYFSSFVGIGGS